MQIGEYIKLILEKKKITQQELVNRLNKINLNVNGGKFTRFYISNCLTGTRPVTPAMARLIELALKLPKYSIVKLVGLPTTASGQKELENIDTRCDMKARIWRNNKRNNNIVKI